MKNQSKIKSNRNPYISYLRGLAILAIITIHLVDWSGAELSSFGKAGQEWLYLGLIFFVALAGSVVFIAYARNTNSPQVGWRLVGHGLKLIGIYYAYNLIKLWVFNFDTEPFYWQFSEKGWLDLGHVLTLKSFTVPISILLTIGAYLIISPLFIYLVQRVKYSRITIAITLLLVVLLNYGVTWPHNMFTDFLWARSNIMFPLALWLIPYLAGFYLAMWGFEKYAGKLFIGLAGLATLIYLVWQTGPSPWSFNWHIYPLNLYAIVAGFAVMLGLVWLLKIIKLIKSSIVKWILGVLQVLGDASLFIYVAHWVVIDLTYWLLPCDHMLIWTTVPLAVIVWLFGRIKRLDRNSY
ncbi:MAG: acyltransferase family protein [Patescibacteria group bacterium]|jgi:peptidoglycan/LPS O-acetylase OafA/YrhL